MVFSLMPVAPPRLAERGHLQSIDEFHAVGQGWPAVLANLKTLLETGDVLPQAPWEFHADERAARMAKNG